MEELRKDVECTSGTMMPTAMVAGHPHQVAAAAAVAASVLASRNAAAAVVSQNSALDMNRSPLLHGFNLHAAAAAAAGFRLTRSEGAESSTTLISSPNFQASRAADSRSPQIRVTDSDG